MVGAGRKRIRASTPPAAMSTNASARANGQRLRPASRGRSAAEEVVGRKRRTAGVAAPCAGGVAATGRALCTKDARGPLARGTSRELRVVERERGAWFCGNRGGSGFSTCSGSASGAPDVGPAACGTTGDAAIGGPPAFGGSGTSTSRAGDVPAGGVPAVVSVGAGGGGGDCELAAAGGDGSGDGGGTAALGGRNAPGSR